MAQIPNTLLHLFARRWCIPILAELKVSEGSKFVTLSRRLGASPVAVRQSLDHLISLGLAQPNPGYGHPLRPEYILTESGDRLAPASVTLDRAITRLELRDSALLRWSMPALFVIGSSPGARFSEIGSALGPVTDRALSQTLKRMQADAVVKRHVDDSFPPAPIYAVDRRGRPLIEPLMEIGAF
ncbi:MAG: winged helix-turn-helix transcriptional regulator [Phycisphaeraceae bacterium]|nr:winged helix-turn-helix transcriptional regulator [Phycisphaeraceae bacterium]